MPRAPLPDPETPVTAIKRFSNAVQVIAGNVATPEGALSKARVAAAPSPLEPAAPVPAAVLMICVLTTTIVSDFVSVVVWFLSRRNRSGLDQVRECGRDLTAELVAGERDDHRCIIFGARVDVGLVGLREGGHAFGFDWLHL